NGDWCAEHGFPESACPVCNPMDPPAGAESGRVAPGTRIRFEDAEVEEAAGIGVEPARSGGIAGAVSCTARVEYDRNRMADVRALVPGIVREVRVDLGERVEGGDALFVLESARVGETQGKLEAARQRVRAARANLRRQRELREASIASARAVELARRDLGTARAEARALEAALGMTGAGDREDDGRYAVTAPLAGTVVKRPAVLGVLATAETSLATVADTSRMWALLDVPEAEAAAVRVGQPITLRVDGVPNRTFRGELTWVGSEVDRRTRTVEARAEIPNPDGLLRAHQFARASLEVGAPEGAVTVPRGAVQRYGGGSVIFVRSEAGVYEPREVRTGRRTREHIQVHGAIRPGEEVVTTGAYLLKTELDPGSIGAGCCEVD
ncbi:MAG: efflux RND transporter periplasmic adaptor subunit, partial [Myxococcota bacterium]